MKNYLFLLLSIITLNTFAQSNPNKNLDAWVGKYSYEEEPIKAVAGYAMAMQWDLTITKNNDQYQGVLEVNGQQTFIKYAVKVMGNTDQVALQYVKALDGVDEHEKKDAVLFMLKKDGKRLITVWAAMEERLPEKSPKQCSCFILKK